MTNTINTHLGTAPVGHGYHLPVRCQFHLSGVVIAGTPGAHGDAGWSTVPCASRREMDAIAASYPQARMPAWLRLGIAW